MFHDVNQAVASSITPESCLIRATHRRKGRTRWLAPGTAAVRHLHYGRIILSGRDSPLEFSTGTQETGLICLRGAAAVSVAARRFALTRYDALYVPRDSMVLVDPSDRGCDFAEISAPVSGTYPVQFVSFADVRRNPSLHIQAGGPNCRRDLNILICFHLHASPACHLG